MDTTTKLSLNDFWLTDESGTTVKFKLTTPLSFGVSTYPRGALQTQVGRSTYSDLTPPHNEENQQTAEGGRGATRFSLDRTQYFDGDGVLAQVPDQVILQGLEQIHLGVDDKAALVDRLIEERGLQPEQVAAIGDDLPDLDMFDRAGLRLAPPQAVPEVRERADWVTRATAGAGCLREACDLLLAARASNRPN